MLEKIIKKIEESDNESFTKKEVIDMLSKTLELPIIEGDGITLNPNTYFITINGESRPLPKKMFEIAYFLLNNKNRLVRRNKILSVIWGDDVFVGDRTIDVHIRKLRALNIPNIVTQKGVGYMWLEK